MLMTALDMQQPDIHLNISCLGDHLVCLLILLFNVSSTLDQSLRVYEDKKREREEGSGQLHT